MTRSRKVFGLALMGIFALSAFMTQGVSAAPLTCEGLATGSTCFTSGDQDGGTHVFKSAGGSVSCAEATFNGEGGVAGSGGAVNESTISPSYPTEKAGGGNNCTAFGFAGAHVKTNECTYTFTEPTEVKAGEVTWSGSQLHLVCPAGKAIEITPTAFGASVCTQTVAPQTPTGGHIVGRNVSTSTPMDATLEIKLTAVHYTGTGSSCGNSETHSDATLTGNSTVKCFSDAARTKPVGCTFPETGATTTYLTGDQDGGTHVFKSAGGSVSCVEADFPGAGPSLVGEEFGFSHMTITPSYPTEKAGGGNNCTAFGFAGAHVKTNECTYTFTEPTEVKAGEVTWSGSQLHLVCPAGKAIEITPTAFGASVCTQTVAPQTPTGGHIVGRNVSTSTPMDATLEIKMTAVHYTGTGSSCGNSETHSDATLTGNSTVKCFSDAARTKQVDCTFG